MIHPSLILYSPSPSIVCCISFSSVLSSSHHLFRKLLVALNRTITREEAKHKWMNGLWLYLRDPLSILLALSSFALFASFGYIFSARNGHFDTLLRWLIIAAVLLFVTWWAHLYFNLIEFREQVRLKRVERERRRLS
jgi:hypothetical protein